MRHTADTPNNTSRYTVPEAAQALGISPEAVRNRLSRGTLDSVKENGSVFVLLDADKVRYADGTTTDRSQHTGGTTTDILEDPGALIASKDETIRVLLSQLEAERAASAEMRRIVAGLVQRVPELEPAREASSELTGASVSQSDSGSSDDDVPPQEPERRSWWRRLLEG
jgi:hypothetical protein